MWEGGMHVKGRVGKEGKEDREHNSDRKGCHPNVESEHGGAMLHFF